MLPYGSDVYKIIKQRLPYVLPHGTFHSNRRKEDLEAFSGYFFFDVDAGSLPEGPEALRNYILNKYTGKIALLGKSVGGRGLFFYMRVEHPELLTAENFDLIHQFLRESIVGDIPTDKKAGGIARPHIIPSDANLYINLSARVHVPDYILSGKKTITRCTSNTKQFGCTGDDSFLDIKEIIKVVKISTEVDVGNLDVLVQDIPCCKVFIPRVIKDDKKHRVFRSMINCIMHNNPGLDLIYVRSFIHLVNKYYTDGRPMAHREMLRTVEAEYNRILSTGAIYGLKNKRYHSNSKDDRITRIRKVARVRGEEQKQRSIALISEAVKLLKEESASKPTIKEVAKLLKGKLSIATITRHWRSVVPKRIID